jgi:hypothetical protein
MKIKNIIFTLLGLFVLPLSAFAISAPVVKDVPGTINANTYTLTINVDPGSKVTVVGGPSDLAPVTDGAGTDKLDGVVKIMVGLAQEATNVFSITAEKNGQISNSTEVTIKETSSTDTTKKGDVTPPAAPILDSIKNPVADTKYTIKGSSESLAKIYVENTDGVKIANTAADSNGIFDIDVDLVPAMTNRFNIYAVDAAGNVGPSVQAVIESSATAPVQDVVTPDKTTATPDTAKTPETITISPFTDIKGHWAETYINQIYGKGIANGKTSTSFDPNANITRAELTKIALTAFGHATGNKQPTENPFADVQKGEWYGAYVALAKDLNIVQGFTDGFHPNESITRAGALKILLTASGLDIGNGTTDFTDVPEGAWFAKYVAFAKTNDIVGGYSDNTFRPDANITRAEVAKIVVKILGLVK